MILAITGGTGFVGSHLIDQALAAGHVVHALARKPQAARENVEWVSGGLDCPAALASLVAGADAVIHVAGLVNAPNREGFAAANITGTRHMLEAATQAGVPRFVHVSSLAAREPNLSEYGWSKAGGDDLVRASGLDWTIVRPPAVFGPRDTEMLELFRLAKKRVVPLPPSGGRLSAIYVVDLARLLLRLATDLPMPHAVLEPDDGTPGGWDHRAFARAIGTAVGVGVMPLSLPRPLLDVFGRGERLLRGPRAKLTPDRIRYFCHPDWTSHQPPPPASWTAEHATPAALAETAQWYRSAGLL